MPNRLAISAGPAEPYILVTGYGLWTPQQFEQHFRDLDRALRTMRIRAGFGRVLVDLSLAHVQTAECAAVMSQWTGLIYRERDEVAVICGTTLLSMQIRREAKIYHRATFQEKKAAIAWLLSEKAPDGAGRPSRSA